jgi:hypothetical protein
VLAIPEPPSLATRLTDTVEVYVPAQAPKLQRTIVDGAVASVVTVNWLAGEVPPELLAVTLNEPLVEAPDVQL